MPGHDVPVGELSWAAYQVGAYRRAGADGTITWNATTMVLVRAWAGGTAGTS